MGLVASVPTDRRARRAVMLAAGLSLYGFTDGLLLEAGLGVDPWDVLHQGLARTFGGQVGTWAIGVGALVLLSWIPLRQRPGVGTICNVVLVGLAINATLWLVAPPHRMAWQVVVMLVAVVLNGVATGLYIGAGLGPGPRDGVMTGLAARGHSVRVVRTAIEVLVLAAGWSLGGAVGIGTIAYAFGIGPLTHVTMPFFRLSDRRPALDRVP